jgi:hypothetical protein
MSTHIVRVRTRSTSGRGPGCRNGFGHYQPLPRTSGLAAMAWPVHRPQREIAGRHRLLGGHPGDFGHGALNLAADQGRAYTNALAPGVGHGGFVRHGSRGRAGQSGRSIGRGVAFRRVGGQTAERSSAVRPAAFRSCHQAELFGRIVRVHPRGPRLARATR